ncbi:PREDICTED: protein lin-28 homolog [Bactrocera latifrons]|uniref:Protein lin-28 n=1 Tax=Bactrocera latifrons TaxID=174628 RepID=A0A0K8V591_BACLA|nr:PREDICTED: protein lin-28 homolog [Bactrocera latifrons]XP_018791722.1 PREDICTED: protein lin-28 homolog [Bactrocera latifrons]
MQQTTSANSQTTINNNNTSTTNNNSNTNTTNTAGNITAAASTKPNNNNNLNRRRKPQEKMAQQQQHAERSDTSPPDDNKNKDSNLIETGCVRYGKCKWFNVAKGWGFITPHDGGQEVFVHQSVIQMSGFRSLGEQEEVEFECQLTERGLEATRVSGSKGLDCTGSTFRPRTKKRRRVRCYNCGKFANHIASMCPQEPQPKRCHICKSEAHFFADCPMRQESTANAESAPMSNDDKSQCEDAAT